VALVVGSRGDGGAVGRLGIASRTANAGLKTDDCSKPQVVVSRGASSSTIEVDP